MELRVTKQWNQAGKSNSDTGPGGINLTTVSQTTPFFSCSANLKMKCFEKFVLNILLLCDFASVRVGSVSVSFSFGGKPGVPGVPGVPCIKFNVGNRLCLKPSPMFPWVVPTTP